MDAVRSLRKAEVDVAVVQSTDDAGLDAVLEVTSRDVRSRFAVQVKGRAPYPNELIHLAAQRERIARIGEPMLVAPFVNDTLASALRDAGWSWADGQGNFDLRAPGLVLRQRTTSTPPKPRRTKLPHGSGSLAIVRALIRFGQGEEEEPSATALAAQAKVSQPRASQVLHQLLDLDLVERMNDGRWSPRRDALLDRFLAEYRGPGGSEQYLYSLDPPTDVAVRAARLASVTKPIVVSADVGPDLLLAWRRPSVLILYTQDDIDLSELGLVEAQGRHDANVIMRNPRDLSVFPVPEFVAELRGVEVPLADAMQQIWDLQDLGGADRLEAAGMLREWLLKRP